MRNLSRFISVLAVSVLFYSFTPFHVSADMAAPLSSQIGGAISSSNTQTMVSMEDEKVDITCNTVTNCQVHAVFMMKNNGQTDENMLVAFPADATFNNTRGQTNADIEIKNFYANGQLIPQSNIASTQFNIKGKKIETDAFTWNEKFPAGQITQVTVSYDGPGSDLNFGPGEKAEVYSYVIFTGSTWYGPIKHGEVNFILPYNIPDYAFVKGRGFSNGEGDLVLKGLRRVVSTNTVTFTFDNFKPNFGDEITIDLYSGKTVQEIESLKSQVQNYNTVLKIADDFRYLSSYAHGNYVSEPATSLARQYYKKAIGLASSENDLLDLVSDYGELFLSPSTPSSQVKDLLRQHVIQNFSFTCDNLPPDDDCVVSIYTDKNWHPDLTTWTDFGHSPLGVKENDIQDKDFLYTLADKMRQYDYPLADKIVYYTNYAKEFAKTYNAKQKADLPTTVPSATQKGRSDNFSLTVRIVAYTILFVFLLVIIAVVVFFTRLAKRWVKRKSVKQSTEPTSTDTFISSSNPLPEQKNTPNDVNK